MNVLEALSRKQGFTDTEAAIADYVLGHVDEAITMNIGELGRAAHCSNSGIVRLCHKLGLEGYRELRVELVRSVERTRMGALEVNPDRPFIENATTRDITSSIARLTKQAIDASYANIKTADVNRAARLILNARHIAYYGSGDSLVSLEMFATLLVKTGVVCIPGFLKEDAGAVGQLLDSHDLVIIVSHSGRMLDVHKTLLDSIRAKGVRTIVITANPELRARLVGTDCFIQLPQGENRSERLATFFSQTCIRYVLNCIYAEVFANNYRENAERWSTLFHEMEGDAE